MNRRHPIVFIFLIFSVFEIGCATPEKRCQRGDGKACIEATAAFISAQDEARAKKTAELACRTAHHGPSCGYVAALLFRDRRATEALRFAQMACDQNVAAGCGLLANILVASGEDLASAFLAHTAEKGCQLGDKNSCQVVLSQRVQAGQPPEEIIPWAERGCSLDEAYGCGYLALRLAERGELSRAEVQARKACQLGDPTACCGLAKVLHRLGRDKEALAQAQRAGEDCQP